MEVETPNAQPPPAPVFRLDTAIVFSSEVDEKNMDEFLIAFEKICWVNKCPEDKYATTFTTKFHWQRFQGSFSELTGNDFENYPTLKVALHAAYSVVSEVYRKWFRNLSKRNDETFSDFGFLAPHPSSSSFKHLNMQWDSATLGTIPYKCTSQYTLSRTTSHHHSSPRTFTHHH